MRQALLLVSLVLTMALTPAIAAKAPAKPTHGNAAMGRVLAQTCVFCHGIKDYMVPYPTMHVPKVGGQRYKYIINALHEYAKGDRDFATMHAQAASLTPQQIRDVAAWFSSEGPKHMPKNGKVKAPAFAATCAACHGSRGVSTNPRYPSLAGQYSDYLLRALEEYKSGKRKNPIMNGMAASLSYAQMKRLANYFSSQPPALRTLPHPGPH